MVWACVLDHYSVVSGSTLITGCSVFCILWDAKDGEYLWAAVGVFVVLFKTSGDRLNSVV